MTRTRANSELIIVALLLVIALAAALRFYHLSSQSLWSDEGNSAALATRTLAQITRDAANDIHPPLYYWLLRGWTRVFGTSEAGLRSLSTVLGIVLVLITMELGRRMFDRVTGLAAGLIAAITPFQVYYSQEARMYMLLAVEAALSMLLFWRFVSQEDGHLSTADGKPARDLRWPSVSGLSMVLVWTAGLYTHYAFALIIGLTALLYLAWLAASGRRGLARARLLRWLLLLALALGLYAPWLPTAVRQLAIWPTGGEAAGVAAQVQTLLATLAVGPLGYTAKGLNWIWILPALALFGALPWPFLGRGSHSGSRQLDGLRWLTPVAWVIAPLAMIVSAGLFREAYFKFLLVASPAFALLLARSVLGPWCWLRTGRATDPARQAARRSRILDALSVIWIVVGFAAVCMPTGLALALCYTDPLLARDDYRSIAQFIIGTSQTTDAVLLTAPGQSEVFSYYYQGDLPVYALPRQRPIDPDATTEEMEDLLQHKKIYAIYWAAEEADPEGVIRNWMDRRGYKTLDQWRGNVRLTVYVMPENRAPDDMVDNLQLTLGKEITLRGYRGWELTPTAGEVTQLQLMWHADRAPTRRYKVFLQLLDQRDQVIAQRDAEPSGESRPTDGWKAGEVILDNHGLLIPPGTPPGTYRCIVGMYDAETMVRLQLPDGSDFVPLRPITVTRTRNVIPLAALNMQMSQPFTFGAITLLGHDRYKRGYAHALDTPLRPGDLLHVTFYWRANAAPRADWWFELTLNDSSGRIVAVLEAPLVAPTYMTTLWQEGEIVRGEHDLLIPPDLPPNSYGLTLNLMPDAETYAGTDYLGAIAVQAPAP